MLTILKTLISLSTVFISFIILKDIFKSRKYWNPQVSPVRSFVMGFIVDFFDALGVGSYPTTILLNKFFKQIPEHLIPGTLNVAVAAIPVAIESLISLKFIQVDTLTLVLAIIMAGIGGFLGSKIIAQISLDKLRLILGILLLIVAMVQSYKMFYLDNLLSEGSIGLLGFKLILASCGMFFIGMLQSWGMSFFAPTLALYVLLGMNSKSVFPIMFCASLAAVHASVVSFIKTESYEKKASLFIIVGGILGCLLAIIVVKSLPVMYLNILVVAVLVYIGGQMFLKGLLVQLRRSY